ncbi:acyltransferase [Photobacterium sp. GB-50]|uniref:acyltransferase family protein n=1 Tax=Photobacterium sp. GB-50 TaxID=2022107 RepID=UPI000D158D59|nr:acyltransferase [Photobacterium sp. GB-50]PSW73531.1 acyltransferase [Photobacterium sp. GB-50]
MNHITQVCFFFISAYFVTSSQERKGQRLFIKDKCIRLGIPVLISLVVINPFIDNGFINNFTIFIKTGNIDLGVTWFCWTLIVFSIVYSIVVNNKAMVEERIDSPFPAVLIIIVFAFILIPLNNIFLYLQNVGGYNLMGFRSLGNSPAYIAMFCLGIQAYRYQWLDKLTVKHASVGICIWLFAFITMFYLHAINSEYASSSYVLIRGFTAIGMSMCVLYVFKTFFNKNNDWTKWLSRTAFAAYVFQDIALYSVAKIYQPLMTQTPLINFVVVGIPSVIIAFA